MMRIETYTDTPNFSVVVPAACKARCQFCFSPDINGIEFEAWLTKLTHAMVQLPPSFTQVSVTGGEPTNLSMTQLTRLLGLLRHRFEKIVVTTNGEGLGSRYGVLCMADHVNLSYHGLTKELSDSVFGAKISMPMQGLCNILPVIEATGTDVTLNCVVGDIDDTFVKLYVKVAQSVGVNRVCFRRRLDLRGLDGRWIPRVVRQLGDLVSEGSCPVCAEWTYFFDGSYATFKAGVDEPVDLLDKPYEVIFHANGRMTYDWAGKRFCDEVVKKTPCSGVKIKTDDVEVLRSEVDRLRRELRESRRMENEASIRQWGCGGGITRGCGSSGCG